MLELILQRPGKLVFRKAHITEPSENEALVRVLACGICGTDFHAFRGRQPFFSYPRRLGHELAVEIIIAPEESGLKQGNKCTVEPYFHCNECTACKAGKTNCCHNLRVMGVHFDGGFTPELVIPVRYLHNASALSLDQIAMVEPLAVGAHAAERANPKPDEPVAIFGMGPIGLAAAIFAKTMRANLALIDLNEFRLQLASETMNLGIPIPAGEGIEDRLISCFGQLPSCVIDATGSPRSMNSCFNFIEHGGRAVFVGLFNGDLQFSDVNFHKRELSLYSSRAALSHTFSDIISMIEAGNIDPLPLITHRLNFESLDTEMLNLCKQQELVKAIIDF